MDTYRIPGKFDLTPRKHHGYAFFLFILGTLLPPLAVAARFGIGKDFWINCVLTLCGYIPGHAHNFYIQNIRNNKNHARTPKWAQRYGLVDTSEIRRKERKSRWAARYNERSTESGYEAQPYEDGQVPDQGADPSDENRSTGNSNGEMWSQNDERYYSRNNTDLSDRRPTSSTGRWHYPANFDDAVVDVRESKRRDSKKKEKKDRWARTEDAYSLQEEVSHKKKKKKKRGKSAMEEMGLESRDNSTEGFPEDPEGGLYGPKSTASPSEGAGEATQVTDVFSHEL